MIAAGYMLLAAGTVIALASLARNPRWLRGGLALAGAIGLATAIEHRRWWLAAAAFAILAINLLHLLRLILGERRVVLREEEQRMAERALPGMSRGAVRSLLDQGLWIDGKADEVLIREGEPVSHLFYLSEGAARVTSGGRPVADCRPGHFLGEITVLSGAPATATVGLATRARFWCVAADALRGFLAANPELRPAVERAFVGEVAEKLRLANARLSGGDTH